jgi:hypothetical protein
MDVCVQLHAPAALPQGKSPRNSLYRSLGTPQRTVLDAVKKKIPSSPRESNPRIPIVQAVAQRYTDWAITAVKKICSNLI